MPQKLYLSYYRGGISRLKALFKGIIEEMPILSLLKPVYACFYHTLIIGKKSKKVEK